jgi:hypothetical protein
MNMTLGTHKIHLNKQPNFSLCFTSIKQQTGIWKCRPNYGITKDMQQGNENELLGITLHTYIPTTKHIDQQRVNDLNTLHLG